MTKKDYITIANALKPFYNFATVEPSPLSWDKLTMDIINAITKQIKKDNPTFDPVKFLNYLRA